MQLDFSTQAGTENELVDVQNENYFKNIFCIFEHLLVLGAIIRKNNTLNRIFSAWCTSG
jgi:hypothetical protein